MWINKAHTWQIIIAILLLLMLEFSLVSIIRWSQRLLIQNKNYVKAVKALYKQHDLLLSLIKDKIPTILVSMYQICKGYTRLLSKKNVIDVSVIW